MGNDKIKFSFIHKIDKNLLNRLHISSPYLTEKKTVQGLNLNIFSSKKITIEKNSVKRRISTVNFQEKAEFCRKIKFPISVRCCIIYERNVINIFFFLFPYPFFTVMRECAKIQTVSVLKQYNKINLWAILVIIHFNFNFSTNKN